MIRRLQPTLKCSFNSVSHGLQTVADPNFKNEQSFNIYISSLCKQKVFKDALQAFDLLEKNGDYMIDQSTYTHLIYACSSLRSIEYGRKIHNHISKSNLLPSMILENHILNMYGKCGSTNDARNVFDNMRARNVVTWTALIAGYSQSSQVFEAVNLYIHMQLSGFMPDQFTFGSVVKACANLNDAYLGAQLHAQVIKSRFGSHLIDRNALIAMYTKFGQIDKACSVFSHIESKDLISWSSMIAGFSKLGYESEALYCFKEMLSTSTCKPNEFILGSVFSAYASLGRPEYGKQIHGLTFGSIEDPDIVSWNALIAGFAYGGDANEAMSIFSRMRRLSAGYADAYKMFDEIQGDAHLVSWNAIITMCMHQYQVEQVFSLFKILLLVHGRLDHITLSNVLGACGRIASLEMGDQIFCSAVKNGLDLDIIIVNGLIDMFVKCGHVGLVDEGMELFKSMEKAHNVVPAKEHYSSVVDLLARAGRIHETEAFMVHMGFEPDIVMWKTLLSACRNRGNVEVGKREAENILKIYPSSCAAQVLLCGVYVLAGDWKDMANLGGLMREKGVRKVPGRSWIEVKDRVHVFSAEDGLHPERHSIFVMVEELWLQILDAGYIPSLD
ncbi:hypothetical protein OROMI_031685 [Orobanche minor]